MSKKNRALPPRVKRLKRPQRLQSAKTWITTFTGKNLLRGYCRRFAVDWRCAAIELKLLGISIDSAYLAKRERSEAEIKSHRQARKEEDKSHLDQHRQPNQHWHPFTDTFSAFLAGDFEALHELEMRQADGEEYENDLDF